MQPNQVKVDLSHLIRSKMMDLARGWKCINLYISRDPECWYLDIECGRMTI